MIIRKPSITKYNGCYEQCDEVCEKCKHALFIGDILYCGYVPGRCGLHETIRDLGRSEYDKKRKCIFCKYYTLDLKSTRCSKCLGTINLDNYKVDPVIENEEWFIRY